MKALGLSLTLGLAILAVLPATAKPSQDPDSPDSPAPAGLPDSAHSAPASLPPIACVEALRRARIEPEASAAKVLLENALALPGCELPTLAELMAFVRTGVDPTGSEKLQARLLARLVDLATPIPRGLIAYLVHSRVGAEEDQLLVDGLEARLAASAAENQPLPERELAEIHAGMVHLFERLGEPARARELVENLLPADNPSSEWHWRAVFLDSRLERWQSVATLLEGMQADPAAALRVRSLYATTLVKIGRYDDALAALDALDAPPTGDFVLADETQIAEDVADTRLRISLEVAWAMRDAGRDREAEALFQRVLTFRPDHEGARAALLHLYASEEMRAEHAAAVSQRREAETDPGALFNEGSKLLAAGDLGPALELLTRAAPDLAGTPMAEAAWYNLGLAAFKLERWQQSADAFEQAASLNPQRPDTHRQRGMALYQAKRCTEAVSALKRAIELAPERGELHYYLAACYDLIGDKNAAVRHKELYQRAKAGGSS